MERNYSIEVNEPELYDFLINAPKNFKENQKIKKFQLKNGDNIHCLFWNYHFFISGTDIVKILIYRFQKENRTISNIKKFEEGIFSDLRNLKPGIDSVLEEPRSEFLEFLYKNGCIRTQKKQKVFYWYSVPHDVLFCDGIERDLRRISQLQLSSYNNTTHTSHINHTNNYYSTTTTRGKNGQTPIKNPNNIIQSNESKKRARKFNYNNYNSYNNVNNDIDGNIYNNDIDGNIYNNYNGVNNSNKEYNDSNKYENYKSRNYVKSALFGNQSDFQVAGNSSNLINGNSMDDYDGVRMSHHSSMYNDIYRPDDGLGNIIRSRPKQYESNGMSSSSSNGILEQSSQKASDADFYNNAFYNFQQNNKIGGTFESYMNNEIYNDQYLTVSSPKTSSLSMKTTPSNRNSNIINNDEIDNFSNINSNIITNSGIVNSGIVNSEIVNSGIDSNIVDSNIVDSISISNSNIIGNKMTTGYGSQVNLHDPNYINTYNKLKYSNSRKDSDEFFESNLNMMNFDEQEESE